MSESYDTSLFARDKYSFVLTHRFKHICSSLYGTLKLGIQVLSTYTLMRTLPYPLNYLVLYFFLIFSIILCFLIIRSEYDRDNHESEDPDLLDSINSQLKDRKNIRNIGVLIASALILELGLTYNVWKDETMTIVGIIYWMVVFYISSCIIRANRFDSLFKQLIFSEENQ